MKPEIIKELTVKLNLDTDEAKEKLEQIEAQMKEMVALCARYRKELSRIKDYLPMDKKEDKGE